MLCGEIVEDLRVASAFQTNWERDSVCMHSDSPFDNSASMLRRPNDEKWAYLRYYQAFRAMSCLMFGAVSIMRRSCKFELSELKLGRV